MTHKNRFLFTFFLVGVSLILRYFLTTFLSQNYQTPVRLLASVLILFIGGAFIIQETAKIIEETTEILSERTKIAGGVLQSIGTAFPDMVLGIVAALSSLEFRASDFATSINFALIAAATTFGSNIYNIGYGIWCIYRQNEANRKNESVAMFPFYKKSGVVKPISSFKAPPKLREIDISIDILNVLTVLTSITALSMVIFGRISETTNPFGGDLYQLVRPVGIVIFLASVITIYLFRKSARIVSYEEDVINPQKYFRDRPAVIIWISLIVSGIAILFCAQAMVYSVNVFSQIVGIPIVVTGALAGIIGCLGEISVIHNFTVHSNGRLGDAITGVAMDNIVTIAGASIVAIMGGIFLGGSALILIFVIILCFNTILIWQVSKLKSHIIL